MEYPGVRLGQRGGLFDLYQYYLGGYDQATGDEGPVTTDPFPGAGGGGGGDNRGLAGIDPFRERTVRDYSAEGMARKAGNVPFTFIDQGIQDFRRTFTPDRYYEYTGDFIADDEGTIYPEDFRRTTAFDRLKTGGAKIMTPITALLSAGRPEDAIYSYGGDAMGVGARAGLTSEEVRNMGYLEEFGGVDEYGRDIYGKNVVSAFGDYEQGVKEDLERLESQLIKNATKYGVTWDAETGKITGNKSNIDNFKSMNKLMLQKHEDYSGFDEKVEKAKEIRAENLRKMSVIGQDTTGGITDNIILPMKKPTKTEQLISQLDESSSNILSDIDKMKKQTDRATKTLDKATAPKQSFDPGGGFVDQGGQGEFGGGSKSSGSKSSSKSSRSTSSSWGSTFHGANGGIVDLL